MKKLVLGSFIFASTLLSVGFAQASVLNFDSVTTLQDSSTGFPLDGFQFGSGTNVYDASTLDANALTGSNVAFNENGGSIVITRADDGLFSFAGLSIGNWFGVSEGFSITVFDSANQSNTFTYTFDQNNLWMTLANAYQNVSKLEISSNNNNYFMLDDINLTVNPTTNDVPEPEALALMLLGLPMMGWVSRRKNTTHTL